jgi:hypothetical protein
MEKQNAQDLINEIEREGNQIDIKEFALKKFYPILWIQKQTDLNLRECVGK